MPGCAAQRSAAISQRNAAASFLTTVRFTSCIDGRNPVSDAIDVTPRSVNPQGLMRVNHSRSVETFSANPCMVIKREERTPIAQILRGRPPCPRGRIQTPEAPAMRPAAMPYSATVRITASSSVSMYSLSPMPMRSEIEDRIADQLPGAVEGDVAAAVDVKEPCAHRFERFAGHEQVFGVPAFAQRVDRRMLHQQDRARIVRVVSDARNRARTRTFPGDRRVEQRLLQIPALLVVHRSEVPAGDFHRYKLFTLCRASSAMYDERTSGALAQ